MIKAILIKNFQSHQNSTLEFSDGVNAIIGPSDSGKTAIIRALRWLVWNRPLGDEMRSNWGGDTVVITKIDEYEIIRIKAKGTLNEYRLCHDHDGNLPFRAIKAEVPEEIQKLLNMNEINLQMQLDAPFLLSNSPGEVGAHFNRIAHLDMIDTGTQNVQRWTRSIEQDIRSGEQHLHQQEEELKKYEHIDEFEQRVQILEKLEEQKISTAQRVLNLSGLTADIAKVEADINSHSALLKMEERVNGILALLEEKHRVFEKWDELGLFLDQLGRLDETINKISRVVKYESAVNETLKLYAQKNKLEEKYDNLKSLADSAHNSHALQLGARERLHALQAQFDEAMPDVCPLCGRSG